ncbi:MAG: DUF1697 domain-containing protein [Spirochaetales bacterium]|nr:DUF1697 domain-containing protein [Spirochaetales bacterium]
MVLIVKYIALLRGINVGGNHKVSMMKLKEVFHSLGYASISTYLNTGNVIFTSDQSQEHVQNQIQTCLLHLFSFEIPTLVKSQKEVQFIEQSVPQNWENNQEYKTDVGYLFPESDFSRNFG